jgi:hypothetical protein
MRWSTKIQANALATLECRMESSSYEVDARAQARQAASFPRDGFG